MDTMYSRLIAALFILFSVPAPAGEGEPEHDIPGLELSCILEYEGKPLQEYSIVICREDGYRDTINVDRPRTVFYRIEYGHLYSIVHLADGFRERVMMVNTVVASPVSRNKNVFDYEITMLRSEDPPNTQYDLPVAWVKYDAAAKRFDYSRKYHKQVRIDKQSLKS